MDSSTNEVNRSSTGRGDPGPTGILLLDRNSPGILRPQGGEFFLEDFIGRRSELEQHIRGRRLLFLGGAGSIGAATIREVLPFCPGALHVVDQDENGLAELVRELRSGPSSLNVGDFRVLPLDFGSTLMERFLRGEDPYDCVLNFAAIKHVRSEKDEVSVLRMFETNIIKLSDFLGWLPVSGHRQRVFSVSTDKAANPVSLMGASKRVMEQVLFSAAVEGGSQLSAVSARFANVAFSNGSLLDGFLRRISCRQPLAVPKDTRRFFLTAREAGRLCLLAAFTAPAGVVLIPKMSHEEDEILLESLAVSILAAYGFGAKFYEDEVEARSSVEVDLERGEYPILVTPRDTSGEKPREEFIGSNEIAEEMGYKDLLGIRPPFLDEEAAGGFIGNIRELLSEPQTVVSKMDLVRALTALVPDLEHLETGLTLDDRM